MPTPAYIALQGKTQGNITQGAFTADSVGNTFVEGHEDEILVQEVRHIVTVPTDPQSGQPSGQRVHRPLKFTCALNKAVPLMYNALAAGEMLPTVTLKWFRATIISGSSGFVIDGKSAATVGDVTDHGGTLTEGDSGFLLG
ncbi:type VI secretion system tube protein TssD [Lysobacter auxotrophicus]|uniref:Type VI secretion system tube protein Hcp n=1 Tax=Lysobacter auxotrophicus TaxID=2992573 RepID=A0ABM8DGS9_9GAMM|nr:hypothetical protein LA521A_29980 [Lysobacter auxotrophicus]